MMDEEEELVRDTLHVRAARHTVGHTVHPVVGAPPGRSAHVAAVRIEDISDDTLQIFTLGRFAVLLPSSAAESRGPTFAGKAGLLLMCLLSAPSCSLSREQLMEALWPDQSMRQAQDSLRHSLSRLRRTLAPERDPSGAGASGYLGSDRTGIWVHVEGVSGGAPRIWIDYHRFEALATAALRVLGRERSACDGPTVAAARTAADEALALYCGPFLPTDRQIEWAQPRRLHFQTLWAILMQARAELAVVEKDLPHAALLCSELLQADPDDEEATGRLMCIEAAQGWRSEALRVYQRLCAHFTADVGARPTYELQELERAIRASESQQEARLLLVRQFLPT